MSWWTMPWSPTSWKRRIPCLWQKSRIVWCIFAISGVGGGTQWSSVTTIFSGSQTFIVPISLKGIRAIAGISCMWSRPTSPSTIWPGWTDSAWLARARIFSDIVWPVMGPAGSTGTGRPINMAIDGPKVLPDGRDALANGDEFHAERGLRDALYHLGIHVARDPDQPGGRAALPVRLPAVCRRLGRARPPGGRVPIEMAAEPDRVGARRICRGGPVHRGLRTHLLGREQRGRERSLCDPVRHLSPPDRPRGERLPESGTLHRAEAAGDRRGLWRRRPDLSQPTRDCGTRESVPHALDRPRRDVRRIRDGGRETVGSRHGTDQFQRGGDGRWCWGLGHRLAYHARALGNSSVGARPRGDPLPGDCRLRRHICGVAVAAEGDASDLNLLHRVDYPDRGGLARGDSRQRDVRRDRPRGRRDCPPRHLRLDLPSRGRFRPRNDRPSARRPRSRGSTGPKDLRRITSPPSSERPSPPSERASRTRRRSRHAAAPPVLGTRRRRLAGPPSIGLPRSL